MIDEIIQRQVDAYNERNLIKMMTFFSEDIQIFNFAEQEPLVKGIKEVEKLYKNVFDHSPDLHAEILNRIVFDDKVIDQERVTIRKGEALMEVVAIYELAQGLITRVYFIQKKKGH
ncbi:nuclear transport factor 2 family protein [Pedobacter caeni]|uniref:SnoaL-like domain-containing protein n=1 Tax=Pedobacter caeni TaxID=288992 RepID=A0A1M5DQK2_9SPHI|nr:nuclear transport factor 2 family protein [Pedobacter caeni]SHF69267.1 hypothetical protein SAMN04488522_103342 [Pedobacter caeni]